MTSRERAHKFLYKKRHEESELLGELTALFDTVEAEQKSACTAAVDMAFDHAMSHGYDNEETESHVMMACLHAGEENARAKV